MTSTLLSQVLLSLAIVVVLARLGGFLFERLGQPPVVGEIVAGIAAAQFSHVLLPDAVRPYLNLIAQLGLVIFMLIVGLEVETVTRARTVAAVATGATVLPFLLGVLLAAVIWPWYRVPAGRVPFLLFVGVAVAITAFPVLARILRDRGLSGSRIAGIAMTCAAVIDVVAWLVLAAVIALAGTGSHRPWVMLTLVTAFVLVMLLAVRPALAAAQRRGLLDRVSPRALLIGVLVAAVLAAWFTESIGLHSIFGPFVVGLALPRHRDTVDLVVTRAADLSSGLLLPAFFVVAGLGVSFSALDWRDLGVLAAAIVVSMLGKIAGAAGPARLTGLGGRDALTLGVLLSTRGLTELVVLAVGAASGLLTTTLYTVLVINAVVTTLATGPLLSLLERGGRTSKNRKVETWTPAST
ncbi:cation:proton antiporter domain-containing protein [Actinoplanes sp. HUAS TT8]|uniref:cation:proton antiporter domain-containing protein n=1 Tax=Actinoplanes sp. HUAS TT8 TaxID=3447453 RepID=UPI003F5259E9